MGRKKKQEKPSKAERGGRSPLSDIKEETLQGVLGILSAVLGIFFALAAFGAAGRGGDKLFEWLTLLLGLGYFLLPILCLMLCISFFKSLRQSIAFLQTIGSALFFFSGLGLIETIAVGRGGFIGRIISMPLVSLFDVAVALIVLTALLAISILILFNTSLSSLAFWKKKPLEGDEAAAATALAAKAAPVLAKEPEKQPKIGGMEIGKVPETPAQKPKEKIPDIPSIPLVPATVSLTEFIPPPLDLLDADKGKPGVGDIKSNANLIKRTLANFGIIVEMDEITIGPSVTRYAFKPAEGVKLSKILGLQNNLELALAASPIRIEAPIPGKSLVGIEVPNTSKAIIGLGGLLGSQEFQGSAKPLLMGLGKGISGESHFANLAKMPHILIAGATGSGKSVTIHALITSLIYRNSPENLRFIMVDPKRVELTLYNKIPHLLTPVITDPKRAIQALREMTKEMERRYDILQKHQVRDIESYHKNILEPALAKLRKEGKETAEGEDVPETMPYIVIIIDELADIMQAYPRELEGAIVRLAQMSRAVGIHLMIATQRPSVNVITGLIKANIPARIALQVVSFIDSRTILDTGGAEKLLGAGDMLFISGDMAKPVRIQSAFVTENELKKVVEHVARSYADQIFPTIDLEAKQMEAGSGAAFGAQLGGLDDEEGDALYEAARETVISAKKASTSYLQRKLGIGYARAAKIIDMLEERGVIGPGEGSKPRQVLTGGEAAEFGADEESEA